MRFPWLVAGPTQITAAMYDADDIDLVLANDPIDNPVMLKNHLADIVAFGFGDFATTERVFFQLIR